MSYCSDEISQAIFSRLSHLPVSTILQCIQTYSEISGNIEQSKQLLVWTMGADFVKSFNDQEASDVNKMITSARSGDNRTTASLSNTSQSAPSTPSDQMLFRQR